jgi:GNAT superfamily N-acetyltransferase
MAAGRALASVLRLCAGVPPILIRMANVGEAHRVAELVNSLSEKFILCDFSPEGRERFLSEHGAEMVAERIRKHFLYCVAECEGELVGVVSMRDKTHLHHLFVTETFQRRGLARRLWETAMTKCLQAGNPGMFTVNSSRFAVPVYERFGFRAAGVEQNAGGVIFLPMRLGGLQARDAH